VNNLYLVSVYRPIFLSVELAAIKTRTRRRTSPSLKSLSAQLSSANKKRVGFVADRLQRFVRPGSGFESPPEPIDCDPRWLGCANLVDSWPQWSESVWYTSLRKELEKTGLARLKHHCFSTRSEIDDYFSHSLTPLIETLLKGQEPTFPREGYPRATVWADGSITKSDHGNHRFILSKILGGDRMEFVLDAIHVDWWRKQVGGPVNSRSLLRARKVLAEDHQLTR
jgi:hypothetical protein